MKQLALEPWMRAARAGLCAALMLSLAPVARADGNAAAGKPVYEQNCLPCHGASGKGNGPAAVALNPKPMNFTDVAKMSALSRDTRLKAVNEGGAAVGASPVMPPFKGVLSPQQIEDVLAYVAQFAPSAAPKLVAQH